MEKKRLKNKKKIIKNLQIKNLQKSVLVPLNKAKKHKKRFYAAREKDSKVVFFDKDYEPLRKRLHKRLKYWLFIKPTVSNLFTYVYDALRDPKEEEKLKLSGVYVKKPVFIGSSIGLTGYKGPTKSSFIAAEETGKKYAYSLKRKKIRRVNLVLLSRLNQRIREFLKGFCKTRFIKIRYIYFIPKRAHNGCRLRNKKRK